MRTDQPAEYCCDDMKRHLTMACEQPDHLSSGHCPDRVMTYWRNKDRYGLCHADGASVYEINWCPWCGSRVGSNAETKRLADRVACRLDKLVARDDMTEEAKAVIGYILQDIDGLHREGL